MWRFSFVCAIIFNMSLRGTKPAPVNQEEVKEDNAPLKFIQFFAATIIDFGLAFLLYFLLFFLVQKTPLANNYHNAQNDMIDIQIETGVNTGFFEKTYLAQDETVDATLYTDDGGTYYYKLNNDFKNDYLDSLNANETYSSLKLAYTVNTFVLVLGSLFVSETVFFLVIPLLNKRRASIGFLFAGGRMISKKYVDKARWYQVLGRFAFIFLIDSALFYFAIGEAGLLFVPFITLLFRLFSKNRRALHDFASGIMIIDYKTFVPLVDHEKYDKEEKEVVDGVKTTKEDTTEIVDSSTIKEEAEPIDKTDDLDK